MFQRLKYWFKVIVKDDVPKAEPLLSSEYFHPDTTYDLPEINEAVVAHNHMVHFNRRLDVLGEAMNGFYVEFGEVKGVLGLIKRFMVGACVSGLSAWFLVKRLPALGG
jgi:hypothetical protein